MELKLTSGMSLDELLPLWPGISKCFHIYLDRFGDDETFENMFHQCSSGRRQLWIIMDKGEVILTPITEIVTLDHSGEKMMIFAEIGGKNLRAAMKFLPDMEAWGREQGCTQFSLVGRRGWERLLSPFDYTEQAIIYRKRHGQVN